MKKRILVKLDIFSKIGLGHFSRINNLACADNKNDYFLIYRTDIDLKKLLENSKFKKCFNIGSAEENLIWSDLNNKNVINRDNFYSDINLIAEINLRIEELYGTVSILIIDNYLINQDWFNLFSENLFLNKINLIYIDDFNIGFDLVNLSIFYPSTENYFKKLSENYYKANGLKYCPFSLDLINKKKIIIQKSNYQNNKYILIAFGFFDQLNLSIKTIKYILLKTDFEIIVIISKDSPFWQILNKNYKSNKRVKIINFISNIASVYSDCATSIGTFGLMSLERAFLGLPQINILEEENQKNTMNTLTKFGFSMSFDEISEIFSSNYNLFLFPDYSLCNKLLKKSNEVFGEGVLEWIELINLISA